MTTAMRMALGAGALFLGGLAGGLLGTALFRAPAGQAPATVGPSGGSAAHDEGLRAALEALTDELRRAHVTAPVDDGLREPVNGEGAPLEPAQDFGADRKSTRLNSSHTIQSRMPSSA